MSDPDFIQLTKSGDFLVSSLEMRNHYVPTIIGYHQYCETGDVDSSMHLRRTSDHKNTIYCRVCHFRIEIPLKINNVKKIKRYFKNKFSNPNDEIYDRSEIIDL